MAVSVARRRVGQTAGVERVEVSDNTGQDLADRPQLCGTDAVLDNTGRLAAPVTDRGAHDVVEMAIFAPSAAWLIAHSSDRPVGGSVSPALEVGNRVPAGTLAHHRARSLMPRSDRR